MTQKTVLIMGATGMVGSHVLSILLEDDRVGKVISIGRRTTGLAHSKLHEIEHQDFKDFSSLKTELTGIDVCFYCLGVYQNQVSKEKFYEITCDYQKALTDVLQKTSPHAAFGLFGARGADRKETSPILFARVKGKAENLLHETTFPKKYIFRPGYIHPTGERKPGSIIYKIVMPLTGFLYKFIPFIGIADHDLAKVMVDTTLAAEKPSATFSNVEMRDLVRE